VAVIKALAGKVSLTVELDGDWESQLASVNELSRRATVFVSYVPTDRQIAVEIPHALRGRDFRVFFDVEDLRAGERWENTTKLLRILTN
jgi:hypothetical protein